MKFRQINLRNQTAKQTAMLTLNIPIQQVQLILQKAIYITGLTGGMRQIQDGLVRILQVKYVRRQILGKVEEIIK